MKRFLTRHGGTAKQETPDGGAGLFGSLTINAFWSQNTDLASSNVSPCLRHTHRLSQIPLGGSSSMWLSNTKYCRNIKIFLFFSTRFLTEMVTKHLFEIAWNVCGTRRKSIYDGDKVLGSVDLPSNSMNILFFHFTLFSHRDWGRLAKLDARKAT